MKQIRKIILTGLITLLFFSAVDGQDGHQIQFNIEGLKDTTIYLGYYYGDGTYIKDTTRIDDKGTFSFENDKSSLPKGIYFLVLDRSRLFDFIVGDDQHFSISTKFDNYLEDLKSTGDIDNQTFISYMRFMISMGQQIERYRIMLEDSTTNESKRTLALESVDKINAQVNHFQDSLIENTQNLLSVNYIKAQLPVKQHPSESASQKEKLDYFIDHYWENFDLSDESLLRFPQPIYRQKVENYLTRLFQQDPDTLLKAIKPMIQIAKQNSETYKYLVWNLTQSYQYPKIMGLDAIFVYLFDTYFASGEMDYWANENLKSTLKTRADVLRNTLIGKKAPNLIIQNIDNSRSSLYEIQSDFTVIYFYDPDCGFCKKETPKLRDFSKQTERDVSVYAVCADSSLVKMNEYINEMGITHWVNVNGPRTYGQHYQKIYDAGTTPTIYLLDKEKNILAKKIPADQIEAFLENYENQKNMVRDSPPDK